MISKPEMVLNHSFTLDGLVHCKTQHKAKQLLSSLTHRFRECGLSLHPDKTKIVYCSRRSRKSDYPNLEFDFLGYTFRKRLAKRKSSNTLFLNFTPAVSKRSLHAMRDKIRKRRYSTRTELSIEEIAKQVNPIFRGSREVPWAYSPELRRYLKALVLVQLN